MSGKNPDVEHAVCLVQRDKLHVVEVNDAPVIEVHQATWRCDDDWAPCWMRSIWACRDTTIYFRNGHLAIIFR